MAVLYFLVALWCSEVFANTAHNDVLLQCLTSRGVAGFLCNGFPQPIHYFKVSSSASDGVC